MSSTVAAMLGALLSMLAIGAFAEPPDALAQSALERSQGPPIQRGSGFRLPGGSERVREVQAGLRELGYPTGTASSGRARSEPSRSSSAATGCRAAGWCGAGR